MRKWLIPALAALTAVSVAQTKVQTATLELTFGYVRQADGTKKSVKGLKLPVTLTPITAKRIDPLVMFRPQRRAFPAMQRLAPSSRWYRQLRGGGPNAADLTIYSCDTNDYGIFEDFSNPSSLDDCQVLSSGVGKLWNKLTFGWHYSGAQSNHPFLVRWRIWDDLGTAPAPANAFTNIISDFGGILTTNPGTFKVEVGGIQQAGMVCNDTSIYVAEQYRDPGNLQGEGAFDTEMQVVFNKTPANIGFSDDLFWYDNDITGELDGNYSNPDEQEQLSEGYSNLLYTFKVNTDTTVDQVNPETLTLIQGAALQGDKFSLRFLDDANTYNVRGFPTVSKTLPWVVYECEGAVATQNLTSYRVQSNVTATVGPVRQRIEIFRYGGGTPGWVRLDDAAMTPNVPFSRDLAYGGAIPLSQFVSAGPNRMIKVRMSYFLLGAASRSWSINSDFLHWVVTR